MIKNDDEMVSNWGKYKKSRYNNKIKNIKMASLD